MRRLRQAVSTVVEDLRGGQMDAPLLVERNIRVNTYHGIVSIMALNLAAPFIGIFAVKLGATDFQVGLLTSGPALVSLIAMIPGGQYMDRQVQKKHAVSRFIMIHRVFYLCLAAIPFFSHHRQAWILAGFVAVMNAPASIAGVGWQSFVSRVIPISERATAFATRNRLMNLAGTLMVLVAGRLIDAIGFPWGYQVVFAAAFFFSLLEIWVLGKIDEPSSVPRSNVFASRGIFREMLKHDRFVRYTLASVVFYLCWQIPWPLFTLYQVKVLGANNTWVSLLSLTNTAGTLLGYGFWARKATEKGNLMTLFLSGLGISIVPLGYAVSRSLVTVAVFNMLTGMVISGVNLALLNQLLEVTPEDKKTTYIAYYTTAVNSVGIVAPVVGVALLGGFGYFWAFLICAFLRVVGSLMFLLVAYLERKTLKRSATEAGVEI